MTGGHGDHGHEPTHEQKPGFPRYKDGYKADGRNHTDSCCLFWFLLYIAGMVFTVCYAFSKGDPDRMTHGVDYAGRICGVTSEVSDKPFMYWCGSIARQGYNLSYPKYIIGESTACVSSCPTDTSQAISCMMPENHNFTAVSNPGVSSTGAKIVEQFKIVLVQSVAAQTSYPTQQYGGRFCLPAKSDENDLRHQMINGYWYHMYRWSEAIGSLRDGWPVLLFCAVIALLLGYLYLFLLHFYAGLIMLLSMIGCIFLSLLGGFFFLWAMFISNDPRGAYPSGNPFYQVYDAPEARTYSIVLGLILLITALLIMCLTYVSVRHIDEMVGLVDAACEVIYGESADCGFLLWPLLQSAIFVGLMIFFLLIGLPYVFTTGSLENGEFRLNDVDIPGVSTLWHTNEFEYFMRWYYVIGCMWVWEFCLQLGHFALAYGVTEWYFVPVESKIKEYSDPINRALEEAGHGIGKNVKVRVGGADAASGERVGVIKESAGLGGKVLVIPVGKRGPGVGRNEMSMSHIVKVERELRSAKVRFSVAYGLGAGLWYHGGSIAKGAVLISILRPFRMFVQCVQGFMMRTDDPGVKGIGFDQPERGQQVRGFCALFAQLLDFLVGKWSKMGLVQLVLNGGSHNDGFCQSCRQAFEVVANSGGVLAFLHGALLVYEYFGMFLITMFSTWLCLILAGSIQWFSDVNSDWYIEDRMSTCCFCALICGVVSFSCMSLFNHAADVLLYDVTWNRSMCHKKRADNAPVKCYASGGLTCLIGPDEMDASFEEGFSAHGPGQVGALQQALEAGALQSSSHQPTYFKMSEAGHGHGGGSTLNPMASMGNSVMQQYQYWNH